MEPITHATNERFDLANGRLAAARDRGEKFLGAKFIRDCPACGASKVLVQTGTLATGLTLDNGETPEFGEVIENTSMVCVACGFRYSGAHY